MNRRHLLLLPLLVGCGSAHEEGLSVSVSAQLVAEGPVTEQAQGVRFTRPDGTEVVLSKAFLSVSRLELVPCAQTGWRKLLRALSPVGVAHAHSSENPRVLEAASVLSLATDRGAPHAFPAMEPPPGRYCEAHLTLAPIDAHTHGVPEGEELVGHTVLLEGTHQAPGAASPLPFRLTADTTQVQHLSLSGLSLSAEAPRATLRLRLAYDGWLDGLTLEAEGAGEEALARVASSVSPEVHATE